MTEKEAPVAETTPETVAEPSDLEKARQLLLQDRQRRLAAFQAELEELCARHGVRLGVTPPQPADIVISFAGE